MAMLADARITLDGRIYHLRLTDDALRRIEEAGVDFMQPPLRRQRAEMDRYLTVVFAASAHTEGRGELQWAGLTAEDIPEMISPLQGEEVFAAVNQAIADHIRRAEARKLQPPRYAGMQN